MDFKCNTQHLDSFGWSALPLHFPLLLQSLSMLRDTFPRYISIPPLVASVGTVHFIEPGSAKINILRPAAFAQRTRKARLLLTCGAIHLVPPPASCGEERHMCASRLNCHARTNAGSFQRDSAARTLRIAILSWSQPVMAPGRSLVISLARRAAQIHQYSVFPPSAPCTSERFVKCPQRGKVSPHGGRDPPALIVGCIVLRHMSPPILIPA